MMIKFNSFRIKPDLNLRKMCSSTVERNHMLEFIKKRIKFHGPISTKDFISQCLYNPKYGYYTKGASIGTKKENDFVTASEMTSLFGVCVGYALLSEIEAINNKVTLIEVGPGNGTLLSDVLSIIGRKSELIDSVVLIELNCDLRCKQESLIRRKEQHKNLPLKFFNSIMEVKSAIKGPCVFFMNEFFDTFPIQQYMKNLKNEWNPIYINEKCGELVLVRLPSSKIDNLSKNLLENHYKDYNWAEISIEQLAQWKTILEIVDEKGGSIMNIDYGYTNETRPGNLTCRGFHKQELTSMLYSPGETDITSSLDFSVFTMLGKTYKSKIFAYKDLNIYPPIYQKKFLEEMGINEFKKILLRNFPEQAEKIEFSVDYLTLPKYMGQKFMVQYISHKNLKKPIFFE